MWVVKEKAPIVKWVVKEKAPIVMWVIKEKAPIVMWVVKEKAPIVIWVVKEKAPIVMWVVKEKALPLQEIFNKQKGKSCCCCRGKLLIKKCVCNNCEYMICGLVNKTVSEM